jgi:hypothetical protein
MMMPKPSRKVSRSSTVMARADGDGVVQRALQAAQHAPLRQFREQQVDRIGERQDAVVHEQHCSRGGDRLGERGDAEDGVAWQRRRVIEGQAPEDLGVDVVAAGQQRHHRRDLAALGRGDETVVHPAQPGRVQACAHARHSDRDVMVLDSSGSVPAWRLSKTSNG